MASGGRSGPAKAHNGRRSTRFADRPWAISSGGGRARSAKGHNGRRSTRFADRPWAISVAEPTDRAYQAAQASLAPATPETPETLEIPAESPKGDRRKKWLSARTLGKPQ
jgi:hypothetical protein